jgi:hypothetical protein
MIPTIAQHYDAPIPLPEGLFEPKRRTVLPRLGDAWPEPGRIGLPVSRLDHAAAQSLGARIEEDGRASALRKYAVSDLLQPIVPLIAKKDFAPLRVETIPASSWAASLQNLLAPEVWKRFERQAAEDAGRVCDLCGSGRGRQECHEVWTYHAPARSYEPGIQRLDGLMCLCVECHEIFHPGLAIARGHRNEIIQRLCLLNAWSELDYRRYAEWGNALSKARSAIEWELDLTPFAQLGPFEVGPGWRLDLKDNSLVSITERSPDRYHRARIVGVKWSIGDYVGYPIRSPLPPLSRAKSLPIGHPEDREALKSE